MPSKNDNFLNQGRKQTKSRKLGTGAGPDERVIFSRLVQAVVNFLDENHRLPSMTELERVSQQPAEIIEKVLETQSFDPKNSFFKFLNQQVIMAMYEAATIDKNVPAIRLWMGLMELGPEDKHNNLPEADHFTINISQTPETEKNEPLNASDHE